MMIRLLLIVIASIQLAGCAGVGITAELGNPDEGFGQYGWDHHHGFEHGDGGHFRR